jgi:alpha-glucosidase
MFGDNVLVAPILQEGSTQRNVSLPPGLWYDFRSDSSTAGGKSVPVAAPLERIPFFVRAGAVIPSQQTVQYSTEAPVDPLTLSVYCAGAGQTDSTLYYEDDGHTFEYLKGSYFKRTFIQSAGQRAVTFYATASEGSYSPPPRSVLLRFVGISPKPSGVTMNGKPLTGWTYEARTRTVLVTIPETSQNYELVVPRGG